MTTAFVMKGLRVKSFVFDFLLEFELKLRFLIWIRICNVSSNFLLKSEIGKKFSSSNSNKKLKTKIQVEFEKEIGIDVSSLTFHLNWIQIWGRKQNFQFEFEREIRRKASNLYCNNKTKTRLRNWIIITIRKQCFEFEF